jgi:hypothetical protein
MRGSIALAVICFASCGSGTPVVDARNELPPAVDGSGPGSGEPDKLAYPPPGRQRLQGFVVFGTELHAFQLCGSAALTWIDVEGDERDYDRLTGALRPVCEPAGTSVCSVQSAYVELDATVSGPCQCGHGGKYLRQMRINDVIAAAPTAPSSCVRAVYP